MTGRTAKRAERQLSESPTGRNQHYRTSSGVALLVVRSRIDMGKATIAVAFQTALYGATIFRLLGLEDEIVYA